MKKYLLLCVALFAAVSLHAQIEGGVRVTRKNISVSGGELLLELEIEVSRNGVVRREGWTIIPELSTPDRRSVKLFPHVEIDGPYQRHMRERREVLTRARWAERTAYAVIDAKRMEGQLLDYRMKVPYEPWMDEASLVVRQIQILPGGKRRVFTVDVNGAVDREER